MSSIRAVKDGGIELTFRWLDFKVTNRCNNRCLYCGVEHDPPDSPETLDVETIVGAISDAIEAGFTHIALLGGEPSIRRDIEDVFDAFEDCHNVDLMVITNGLEFNEAMIRSAYETHCGNVAIVYSMDSFDAPNYKNQQPSRIVEHIDRTLEISKGYTRCGLGRGVHVHTVISRENLSSFSEVVRTFRAKHIDVSLALVCPSSFVHEESSPEYNAFTFRELETIMNQLRRLGMDGELSFANSVLLDYLETYPYGDIVDMPGCAAGRRHVVIDFDGSVYPCITESYRRGITFGNIRREAFHEILGRMQSFRCESEFESACWDHYLWNRVGEMIDGGMS